MSISGLVSVIIPTYNYGHFLSEAVQSVFSQTYQNWEIIVVDDESSDQTEQLIPRLINKSHERLSYYRVPNGGVSAARNIGLSKAKGEFVLPLDADDLLRPNALRRFVTAMQENPECGFAYSALELMGVLPGEERFWYPGPFFPNLFPFDNTASCTSVWKRSLFEEGIEFREAVFEDWDLWLQIIAKGYDGVYIPEVLFQYRIHGKGRHTENVFKYYPALLQEGQLNPTLYDTILVETGKKFAVDIVEKLKKPQVAFLLSPQNPAFHNFAGEWEDLAAFFVKNNHFVVALGEYLTPFTSSGIVLVAPDVINDLQQLLIKLTTLGNDLIVFSEYGEEINEGIRLQPNVKLVVGLGDGVGASVPRLSKIDSGQYCFKLHQELKLQDLYATLLTEHSSSKAKVIEESQQAQAAKRNLAMKLDYQTDEKSDVSLVLLACNPDIVRLQKSLDFVRKHFLGDIHLMDWGPSVTAERNVAELSGDYKVFYHPIYSREDWSIAHAINTSLRFVRSEWILFSFPNTLIRPGAFSLLNNYIAEFSTPVFFSQTYRLFPGVEINDSNVFNHSHRMSEVSYLSDYVRKRICLVNREWLEEIEGLSSVLREPDIVYQELEQRSILSGDRPVWLNPNYFIEQWTIDITNQIHLNEDRERLESIFTTSGDFSQQNSPNVSQEAEFKSLGPSEYWHSSFQPVSQMEFMINNHSTPIVERVSRLNQWGDHALVNKQAISGLSAFEDALMLDPKNIEATMGLARAYLLINSIQRGAHYAVLTLEREPDHEMAKEVVRIVKDYIANL